MVPCPNCGCTCEIGADTFDGSLSTWTTTGSPSTGSGLVTLAAGDRIVFTPAPADAGSSIHIESDPQTSSNPGVLRMLFNYIDASNYGFGEFDDVAGTIRLGKRVGGTDFYETDSLTLTSPADRPTLKVCWTPGVTQASEELDTGAVLPTGGADDGGGVSWSSPENITANDGIEATAGLSSGSTPTNVLRAHVFLFNIPSGSTIDGIEASVVCSSAGTSAVVVLDYFQLLDSGGNGVGDDKGTGQVVSNNGVLGSITAGGAADDWNAGLTSEDVNSPGFGVAMQFAHSSGGVTTVNVDYVTITINYTTPARRTGSATFSYTPNGSSTEQCVIDADIWMADGTGTGLQSVSGTWTADNYTLSYLKNDSRPTCPECDCGNGETPCAACDSGGVPLRVQVDLSGVTGSGSCADCGNDFDGTYILDFAGISAVGFTLCSHRIDFSSGKCVGPSQTALHLDAVFHHAPGFTIGPYYLDVVIWTGEFFEGGDWVAYWRVDFGATAPACASLSAESLTFEGQNDNLNLDCDFSAATVEVTAL